MVAQAPTTPAPRSAALSGGGGSPITLGPEPTATVLPSPLATGHSPLASSSLPPVPWPLDPRQQAFLLHNLQDPTQSMEAIANAMQWSLRVLNLYLSTEEGLLLVAQCELATAVRTRIAAAAQLSNAIDALGTMLQEYAHCARRTLVDERKHSTHVLREQQRSNARRAAHLLFRLAHFNPSPIKSYTPAPPPSGGGAEALRGGGGERSFGPSFSRTSVQELQPTNQGAPAPALELQSPGFQPGHMQPATLLAHLAPNATAPAPRACPTAEAVGSEAIPDASLTSSAASADDRCEGRSAQEALRASPTLRQQLQSPPLGRTTDDSQATNAALSTNAESRITNHGSSPLPTPHSPLPPPPRAKPIRVQPPKPKPSFLASKQERKIMDVWSDSIRARHDREREQALAARAPP